jgi:glycosyltransferase involved in cell wall biosynthesis
MKESNRLVRAEPTLSVIMANYNDAPYIGEALEAILAQSFPPREVIVVDDGSTDNSIAVIEEFVRRDPIVRLLRNERNVGLISSGNRALAQASGDYVCWASANDYVLPGLFEKSRRLLAQYPQAGFCSALTMLLKEDRKELGPYPSRPLISETECYVPREKVLVTWRRCGEWWFTSNTAVYRRDALIEAGGFIPELRSYSDAFMLQLLAFKYGACFIPEALGLIRILENYYCAEQATEKYGDLMKVAVRHMRSTHGSVFPKQYVEAFRKENVYFQSVIAYRKLKLQDDECLTQTENSLENPTVVDRLFFSALKLCMAVRHLCLRLYLFLRLRHLSWFLLMRKLRLLFQKCGFSPTSVGRIPRGVAPKTQH